MKNKTSGAKLFSIYVGAYLIYALWQKLLHVVTGTDSFEGMTTPVQIFQLGGGLGLLLGVIYYSAKGRVVDIKLHIGSLVTLVVGWAALIDGIANPGGGSGTLLGGILLILGASAYRSAKKRKLGTIKSTRLRISVELIAISVAIALVLMQNSLLYSIEINPLTNFIIPVWIVLAYVIVFVRRPMNQYPTDLTGQVDLLDN